MRTLNETDIRNIMKGAGLLGSGGGGSVRDGLIMLEAFKKHNPEKRIEVQLADPGEMTSDYAVGIAVMGAPSGGTNLDITECIVNAYDEISRIASQLGKKTGYTLALELGGVNTLVPLLVSLMTGLPMLDADCAGRAVPGLDTVLAAILGCPTAPIAMADIYNNRVNILPADPCNAELIEELALPVVSRFEQNAGIAGWMCDQAIVQSTMIQHSIKLAMDIGEMITASGSEGYADNLFNELNSRKLVIAKTLTSPSRIEKFIVQQREGWDIGEFILGSADNRYHVIFSNENLLLFQIMKNGEEQLIMSAPDIIALVDAATGESMTNDDLQALQQKGKLDSLLAVLGIIKVNEKWMEHKAITCQCWHKYFNHCGYKSEIAVYPYSLK